MADVKTCTTPGCERPVLAKGMCRSHYYAARRLDPSRPECSTPGCVRRVEAREVCKKHYYGTEEWRARTAEATARWKAANAHRLPEMRRALRAAHLDEQRLYYRERQRRRRAQYAEGDVNYADVLIAYGFTCHICTDEIASLDDLHFDHVLPLSRGGKHEQDNVKPAHARCNLRKGNKPNFHLPSQYRT